MKKLFTLLLMLVAMNANAQWVESFGIYTGYIPGIASSGNNVYAASGLGVYMSTNNGTNASWYRSSMNCCYVNCVTASGNKVFAGTGDYHGVYYSSDNGTSWSQTSLNDKIIYTLNYQGGLI